jgi:hypothetical protein
VAEAERDAAATALGHETFRDPDEILGEAIPVIRVRSARAARVAVAARVHGDDAVAFAQRARDEPPHTGAEAVGMVEQRQRALAPEVEECDLDPGVEPEPASAGVAEPRALRNRSLARRTRGHHGRRV